MSLIIPKKYKQKLTPETTEVAIKKIKEFFQLSLSEALNLRRVTAPLFVLSGTGLNDDLNGVERAVNFPIKALGDKRAEVVHSLAFHKKLLSGELPSSIGGGIGQSRLCMFMLQKAHIGEVQASIWPEEQILACHDAGIELL